MKKFEITNKLEIEEILKRIEVCNLAMSDAGKPYVIPMNFGYTDGVLYLHSAPVGKKMDILIKNPQICVSFYSDAVLNIRNECVACSYSMKFRSILMSGCVFFIEDIDEKKAAMNVIMRQYSGRNDFDYNLPAIKNVSLFKLIPDEITAYKRGY
jgi:uncharacterized protein